MIEKPYLPTYLPFIRFASSLPKRTHTHPPNPPSGPISACGQAAVGSPPFLNPHRTINKTMTKQSLAVDRCPTGSLSPARRASGTLCYVGILYAKRGFLMNCARGFHKKKKKSPSGGLKSGFFWGGGKENWAGIFFFFFFFFFCWMFLSFCFLFLFWKHPGGPVPVLIFSFLNRDRVRAVYLF